MEYAGDPGRAAYQDMSYWGGQAQGNEAMEEPRVTYGR